MKTFLVPTDFSSSAKNAAIYAALLAKKMNAKLILFHAFPIPVTPMDMPMPVISDKELKTEYKKRLDKEANQIRDKYKIIAEVLVKPGLAADEIHDLEKNKEPDLIIMGMKRAEKLKEVFIGSTATSLIRKANTPVLLIPEKSKPGKLDKIALSCDYKTEINIKVLSFLRELAETFHSKIDIVNVVQNENEIPSAGKGTKAMKIGKYFKAVKCIYFFPRDKDFVSGINQFFKKNKVEMLAIIPHRHNLLERIFGESNTKRMAFQSETPILALPDTHKSSPTYFL